MATKATTADLNTSTAKTTEVKEAPAKTTAEEVAVNKEANKKETAETETVKKETTAKKPAEISSDQNKCPPLIGIWLIRIPCSCTDDLSIMILRSSGDSSGKSPE